MDLTTLQNYWWVFVGLAIWELVWKGVGMWRAARNKEKYWFAALLVVNSVGILPMVYLWLRRKK